MKDLKYYVSLLDQASLQIVGLGLTAFSRIQPALFLRNFEVVAYKWGSDLTELKRLCPVHTIQEDWPQEDLERLNTLSILRHSGVSDYLHSLGSVGLFTYRTTERVEALCRQQGWELLTNTIGLRERLEDKDFFFRWGREHGLPVIPGEQWDLHALSEDVYRQLTERLGDKLVMQLTSYSFGGGKGTYFVDTLDDFRAFFADAKERLHDEDEKKTTVNVNAFITGATASIAGCATRHGVLTGPVQTQVLDVPELVQSTGRRGIWRGHDWSFRQYSGAVQTKAEDIVRVIGEKMYAEGLKGIFGVDLIVTDKDEVYANEINPRYTGAFPMYSFLQHKAHEIPMEVFVLLEFLGMTYELDVEAVSASWKQQKSGAQLILHNKESERFVQAAGDLPAGVYRLGKVNLEFVREGVSPLALEHPDEFVLTDGLPKQGDLVKPHLRCGRIFFGSSILNGSHDRLNDWARTIVTLVYDGLDLRPIDVKE